MRSALTVFVLVLVAVMAGSQPAYALDAQAPESIIPVDAVAYRNLVECGDLLIFYQYQLPADHTEDALDPAWAEYGTSGALARLLFNGETQQDRVPPRLGHAMLAHYLEAGHGIPWGSADVRVQLGGNPALFVDLNNASQGVNYSSPGAEGSCDEGGLLVESPERQKALDGAVLAAVESGPVW